MTTQDIFLNFAIILIAHDTRVSLSSIKKHVKDLMKVLPVLGIELKDLDERKIIEDLRLVYEQPLDRS